MSRFRNWLDKTFKHKPPTVEAPEDSEEPVVIHWWAHNPHLDELEEHPRIGFGALQKAGETNGRMDHPGPEFQGLDGVESDVAEEFSKTWQGLLRTHGIAVSKWKEALYEADPSILGSDQRTKGPIDEDVVSRAPIVVHACERMKNEIAGAEADLKDAAADCKVEQDKYDSFKKENGLEEDISVHPWWLTLLIYLGLAGLLVGFVWAESVINGEFFADKMGGREAESERQARLISVVNVLVFGILLMVCWRYRSHVKERQRLIARLGGGILLLLVLAFNFGAAHFRDAFSNQHPAPGDECYVGEVGSEDDDQEIPEISEEALCTFLQNPIALSGFDSYAFLLLGLGFVLIGIIDWNHFFPGYPGQLKRLRRVVKARKKLATKKEALQERLRLARVIFKQDLNSKHYESIRLIQQIADKQAELHVHSDELARRCKRHLETYRASNRAFRQDMKTIPLHWSSEWQPTWKIPEPPGGLDLSSRKIAQWIDRLDLTREARLEYVNSQYRDHVRYVDRIAMVTVAEPTESA